MWEGVLWVSVPCRTPFILLSCIALFAWRSKQNHSLAVVGQSMNLLCWGCHGHGGSAIVTVVYSFMLACSMQHTSRIIYSTSSDVCSIVLDTFNTNNTFGAQLCHGTTPQAQSPLNLSSTHVSLVSQSDDISQNTHIQEPPASTSSLSSIQEFSFSFACQLGTSLQYTQCWVESLWRRCCIVAALLAVWVWEVGAWVCSKSR